MQIRCTLVRMSLLRVLLVNKVDIKFSLVVLSFIQGQRGYQKMALLKVSRERSVRDIYFNLVIVNIVKLS